MKRSFWGLILPILLVSCISNKRINYLQNLPGNDPIELNEFVPYAEVDYEYVLQPFDIIDIDFASSNEELTKVFEYQGSRSARGGGGGGSGSGDMFYFTGYSIDKDGMVRIPKLGLIKVAGLTEEDARIKVERKINEYFKEKVFVRLRTGGIRFTTLGEFGSSGTKVILKNRATIFDALAMSGESNILAKKNELYLIRQYDGGVKIHQINLNDRALLASPYFFIQPNDILYLKPMKIRQVGNANNVSSSLQLGLGFIGSILFLLALIQN
ncbi:polysaccharide biosynthesis/export family protein [Echinicola jeungdonensis]|uniref:Polysaccharide biosynthesis/export family protein n=1 Tax=Echinicola jeungdonensis TaxID=709343 RepID=A0ABV5J449_9BACT|nr:polysaccharide biosynthesis/export family protein [Echinicola jeungdonensis]MDN3670088.1 polysaccharide biosynthesis/export family protein [Echinicola jeungdonensis]